MEKERISNIEGEPKHNIIIVDILRHGTTEYKESTLSQEEKDALNGNYPRDLTLKGEEEVRESAEKIAESIDPAEDIVVLWSSPAWRAQGSKEIVKEVLVEKGIQIYKDSSVESMRNFEQKDKKFMDDFWKKLAPTNKSAEFAYARDPEFQEKNDKFESQPEVKKRAEGVFNQIRRLAESIDLKGKRLRIIGVSHFEFLNPVMEDIFGSKVEEGKGINKGENITITFDYDLNSKNINISADFRGEHKDEIIFDAKQRKFIVEK